jgi:hypothetical protein
MIAVLKTFSMKIVKRNAVEKIQKLCILKYLMNHR